MLVPQLCPVLCDPMDWMQLGCSVHGILQERIVELVAFSSPGDLTYPGIEPGSPALQANSLLTEATRKALNTYYSIENTSISYVSMINRL